MVFLQENPNISGWTIMHQTYKSRVCGGRGRLEGLLYQPRFAVLGMGYQPYVICPNTSCPRMFDLVAVLFKTLHRTIWQRAHPKPSSQAFRWDIVSCKALLFDDSEIQLVQQHDFFFATLYHPLQQYLCNVKKPLWYSITVVVLWILL